MIAFPNCKINLGLNIISKRDDNFHNLETVFFPLSFYDIVEILPSKDNFTHLKVTGFAAADPSDNLCIKAFNLLKKEWSLPEVDIHLHKAIPSGAGLGGGSADASIILRLIDKKFSLNVPLKKLQEYALELGSDCPFFLINNPCLATGRGEQLEQIELSLSGYKVLLIHPCIHINTGEAFKEINPSLPQKKIKEIIQQPVPTWKGELINDFEKPVFKKYPGIKKIKDELYANGAVYASLSGSGSTVYGIFNNDVTINYLPEPSYFFKLLNVA